MSIFLLALLENFNQLNRVFTHTHRNIQPDPVLVYALEEFAAEELNAHYRKYKPEHETDEEHVEYTRYRIHQRVHYDLRDGKKNSLSITRKYTHTRSRSLCVSEK